MAAYKFLAALMALPMLPALACSPVKSIDLYFPTDSAAVTTEQVVRLVEWIDMLRKRYPNHEKFFIGGAAEIGERHAKALAIDRAKAAARIFQELQLSPARVELSSKGYAYDPRASLKGEKLRRAEIDFLPACPHECPCQKGDPLSAAPTAPSPVPAQP